MATKSHYFVVSVSERKTLEVFEKEINAQAFARLYQLKGKHTMRIFKCKEENTKARSIKKKLPKAEQLINYNYPSILEVQFIPEN